MSDEYVKGRGAQINPTNRFQKNELQIILDDLANDEEKLSLLQQKQSTSYIEVFPKTIINTVESKDIPMEYSINPYQGCEHGCTYCYARPTHEYWGYSAGKDFEQKILVKKNAAELLKQAFEKPDWKPSAIMLSGNTDCYQPIERKFEITRNILKTCLDFKHPVGVITKNALVLRDIDLLEELAKDRLVWVTLSLTTLDEDLKRILEPRTSSAKNILNAIRLLSEKNIPVNVNFAPIIPSINDNEIFDIAKAVAEAGARSMQYIVVRLNDKVGDIFKDWLQKNFPDRFEKCIHQIESIHGGSIQDKRTFMRMKGEGNWAEIINKQMKLAQRRHFKHQHLPEFNNNIFMNSARKQMKLF